VTPQEAETRCATSDAPVDGAEVEDMADVASAAQFMMLTKQFPAYT